MRYLLEKIYLFWWCTFRQKRFISKLDKIEKDLVERYESGRDEIRDQTLRALAHRLKK